MFALDAVSLIKETCRPYKNEHEQCNIYTHFQIFIYIPDCSGAALHELQISFRIGSPLLPPVGIPALTSLDENTSPFMLTLC